MISYLERIMGENKMEKFKIIYAWLLILLPLLLVGTLTFVSNEKIVIETTNFKVALEEQEDKKSPLTIEVYGQGFKEGDCIYIDGQKQETNVIYNKLLTFKLPTKYLQDKKIEIKVQRLSQAGIAKESSNGFTIEP